MMTLNSSRLRWILSCVVLWAIPFLASSVLRAQITTATISGTISDESGAVLPGVSVSSRDVETGSVRTALSDDSGRYRLPLLEPGTYQLQGELAGFQTAVIEGIKLEVGGSA